MASFAMNETYDGFLGGKVYGFQPKSGFRAGTDTVLLAAAVPAQAKQEILELGAGSGVALLCLGARVEGLSLYGVELVKENADRANRNLQSAKMTGEVVVGDAFDSQIALLKRQYDHVLMNPPFFEKYAHSPPVDPLKTKAHIAERPVADWVKAGLRRVKAQGTLTLIFPAHGLGQILASIPENNAMQILPIVGKEDENPSRVLVHVQNQNRSPLILRAPIILYNRDGQRTEIGEAIARDGATISWR